HVGELEPFVQREHVLRVRYLLHVRGKLRMELILDGREGPEIRVEPVGGRQADRNLDVGIDPQHVEEGAAAKRPAVGRRAGIGRRLAARGLAIRGGLTRTRRRRRILVVVITTAADQREPGSARGQSATRAKEPAAAEPLPVIIHPAISHLFVSLLSMYAAPAWQRADA